ncbi:DUF6308 family protein [Asanoa siamensis]|uniref:Uncharacterized protein n=1 Tax=Asanoa siamensis TaxID=926357 RepID=A0ABQ4CUU4_9ACTN|nr:DUF6308 family protein [Asanoa siamensis]GIF75066.1 hypothetical protein Asi02nite_45840 [Asanoa siamensis]
MSVPPIDVAGWKIDDPLEVVAGWCRANPGVLRRFDFVAGTAPALTPELVAATLAADSRTNRAQAAWLLTKSAGAPWDVVPPAATLAEADPLEQGGLYEAAEALYGHFYRDRPRGIDHTKISTCLYLTRPALFPVLDYGVLQRYHQPARSAARDLEDRRRDRRWVRRTYWAAIRADVLRAVGALDDLRAALRAEGDLVGEAGERLSDIRLIDILGRAAGR